MAKVDEYNFKNIPNEIKEFAEDLRLLLNNGKYSLPVLEAEPTWVPDDGETVLVSSSGNTDMYFALNSTWNLVELAEANVEGWLVFSGTGNLTVYNSFNVTSLTRADSSFLITWNDDFANREYLVVGCARQYNLAYGVLASLANSTSNPTLGSALVSYFAQQGGVQFSDGAPHLVSYMAIGQQ